MKTRRSFILTVTSGLLALAVLVVPVNASELIGTVKLFDADAKKLVVTVKDADKDVDVKVTNKTKVVADEKGKTFDLKKIKKGSRVTVTHDNGVASRIEVEETAKTDCTSTNNKPNCTRRCLKADGHPDKHQCSHSEAHTW